MPKRSPTRPRPPLQGPTTSPAFQPRIRTAQQPTATLMRGLGAVLPGMGTVMGAAMRPQIMKRRGERGR
jgi:hypothetical protein